MTKNLWGGDLKQPVDFVISSLDEKYVFLNDGSFKVRRSTRLDESIAKTLGDPDPDHWCGKQITLSSYIYYLYERSRAGRFVRDFIYYFLYIMLVLIILLGIALAIDSYHNEGFVMACVSFFATITLSAPLIIIIVYGIAALKRLRWRDRPRYALQVIKP